VFVVMIYLTFLVARYWYVCRMLLSKCLMAFSVSIIKNTHNTYEPITRFQHMHYTYWTCDTNTALQRKHWNFWNHGIREQEWIVGKLSTCTPFTNVTYWLKNSRSMT